MEGTSKSYQNRYDELSQWLGLGLSQALASKLSNAEVRSLIVNLRDIVKRAKQEGRHDALHNPFKEDVR